MKYTTAIASLLALAASTTLAQESSYDGKFQFAKFNLTGQDIPAQGEVPCTTDPILELKDGILTDQLGRVGNVVANDQLQFDPGNGQPDAKANSGFGVYSNGSLAVNGDAIWYSCNSGSFDNLYDQSIAPYCVPVFLVTYPCSGSGTSVSSSSSMTTLSTTTSASSSSEASTSTVVATTSVSETTTVAAPVVSSAAPYPAGNGTTPAGTASSSAVATTTDGSSPAATTSAVVFPGAASTVAIGGKFVAVLAGLVAFALY